jgi:hypothetical protein
VALKKPDAEAPPNRKVLLTLKENSEKPLFNGEVAFSIDFQTKMT